MAAFGHCPSGRLFEAAACGTPLLTDYWEGLDEFFSGDEVLVVPDTESVVGALASGDELLQARAKRAQERTLDQHTGDHRARELVAAIERASNRASDFEEQRAEWAK
jgi:spore maturation protein CgeB